MLDTEPALEVVPLHESQRVVEQRQGADGNEDGPVKFSGESPTRPMSVATAPPRYSIAPMAMAMTIHFRKRTIRLGLASLTAY